jgi:hypothetical protein
MSAEPNELPGLAAQTIGQTSVIRVPSLLGVAVAKFKRLEPPIVQPFLRSEKAH